MQASAQFPLAAWCKSVEPSSVRTYLGRTYAHPIQTRRFISVAVACRRATSLAPKWDWVLTCFGRRTIPLLQNDFRSLTVFQLPKHWNLKMKIPKLWLQNAASHPILASYFKLEHALDTGHKASNSVLEIGTGACIYKYIYIYYMICIYIYMIWYIYIYYIRDTWLLDCANLAWASAPWARSSLMMWLWPLLA